MASSTRTGRTARWWLKAALTRAGRRARPRGWRSFITGCRRSWPNTGPQRWPWNVCSSTRTSTARSSSARRGRLPSAPVSATPVEVYEYAPREIKQAIVGRGGADKQQVQHMVRMLLTHSPTNCRPMPRTHSAWRCAMPTCAQAMQRMTRRRSAMIGYLKGTLADSRPPLLVLDVNGVGYEVEAPMSTCVRAARGGQRTSA